MHSTESMLAFFETDWPRLRDGLPHDTDGDAVYADTVAALKDYDSPWAPVPPGPDVCHAVWMASATMADRHKSPRQRHEDCLEEARHIRSLPDDHWLLADTPQGLVETMKRQGFHYPKTKAPAV